MLRRLTVNRMYSYQQRRKEGGMMDAYLIKVPTMDSRDRGYCAFVNDIPLHIDLKGTGADMLKQVLERCFDVRIESFGGMNPTSYKNCVYGVQSVGGKFYWGIDRYCQDETYKYYIAHIPCKRVLWGNFSSRPENPVWDLNTAFEEFEIYHGFLK